MKGIASFLDPPADGLVRGLWQELETKCGLTGAKSTLFPHFTWQVTEDYNTDVLDVLLRKLSRETSSFSIRTDGLGIFTGERPVVYIPIFREASLISFHAALWEATRFAASGLSHFYSPDQWVPHITLGYNDVDPENLSCAIQALAFKDFTWKIRVNNLVFFTQDQEEITETFYEFGA